MKAKMFFELKDDDERRLEDSIGRCLNCFGQGYLNNLAQRRKDVCLVCYGRGGKVRCAK